MRSLLGAILMVVATQAFAASTPRQDAMLSDYFAIWDNNRNVTPETVARLYARRIVYYGHQMSQSELLADKLAFVRRWPNRRYRIEPGSASRSCNATLTTCELTAVLVWTNESAYGSRAGRSRIRLTLVREDGALKIARESAVTLG
jgi:hypothetical protein